MGKWQKSLQCSNCHQYVYLTKKSVRVYYFVWFKMVQKFWGWITTRQRGQQPSSDVMRLSGSVCMDSYTGCPVPRIASLHSLCQLRQTKRNVSFSLTPLKKDLRFFKNSGICIQNMGRNFLDLCIQMKLLFSVENTQ